MWTRKRGFDITYGWKTKCGSSEEQNYARRPLHLHGHLAEQSVVLSDLQHEPFRRHELGRLTG